MTVLQRYQLSYKYTRGEITDDTAVIVQAAAAVLRDPVPAQEQRSLLSAAAANHHRRKLADYFLFSSITARSADFPTPSSPQLRRAESRKMTLGTLSTIQCLLA